MKKIYSARRNALLTSTSVSWGAVALILVLLVLALRLVAPNLFWKVFAPAFQASDVLTDTGHAFFSGFKNASTLSLENERLSNDNAALSLQNRMLEDRLAEISGLVKEPGAIIAGVVARPPTSPYDTLLLSAGSNHGVAQGMMVFGEGGMPLGFVSSVLPDFSRATLFSSPGMTVNGWVGAKKTPLSVKGVGGGAMSASVPRAAEIAVGDVVSLSGPGGLPLGVVKRVESDPLSPSATLNITPALNFFSIQWVSLRDSGAGLTLP